MWSSMANKPCGRLSSVIIGYPEFRVLATCSANIFFVVEAHWGIPASHVVDLPNFDVDSIIGRPSSMFVCEVKPLFENYFDAADDLFISSDGQRIATAYDI